MVLALGYSQCYADVHRRLRVIRQEDPGPENQKRMVARRACIPCRNGHQLLERSRERQERALLEKDQGTCSRSGLHSVADDARPVRGQSIVPPWFFLIV